MVNDSMVYLLAFSRIFAVFQNPFNVFSSCDASVCIPLSFLGTCVIEVQVVPCHGPDKSSSSVNPPMTTRSLFAECHCFDAAHDRS